MAPFDPQKDLPDLTGRVALVTGATSGLGYPVALSLLRKGAKVYLAARNESKAVATIERLERDGLGPGNGKPIWHKLVLDNPKDAKQSAESFLKIEDRLDILVNNAALLPKDYELGPIGVQDIVTVNHISPFIFTNTLLPLLKKTALLPDSDVRVVNVASDAHTFITDVKFKENSDLNGPTVSESYISQMKRYALSKLMNVLCTCELSKRLKESTEDGGSQIITLSLHPGAVASEGVFKGAEKLMFPINYLVKYLMILLYRTPEYAAGTVLIAAASPVVRSERETYDASYLTPIGRIGKISKTASDGDLQRDLWNLTEQILSTEGI